MTRQQRQPALVDVEDLLPKLCEEVRTRGALRWAEVTRHYVPKQQHLQATRRLLESGFETTRTAVRVPVVEQLKLALSERKQIPIKGLQHLLRGCSAKDVAQAIDRIVRAGTALVVLRAKSEWLAQSNADVLTHDQLLILNQAVTQWAKQTQKVRTSRKRSLAIWRSDVRDLLETLVPLGHVAELPLATPVDPSQRLRQLVRQLAIPSVGLAFVPDLVAKLQLPLDQAHVLLFQASRHGLIELRPDAGASRFTETELLAAPQGPDGSRLLWARLLEVGS